MRSTLAVLIEKFDAFSRLSQLLLSQVQYRYSPADQNAGDLKSRGTSQSAVRPAPSAWTKPATIHSSASDLYILQYIPPATVLVDSVSCFSARSFSPSYTDFAKIPNSAFVCCLSAYIHESSPSPDLDNVFSPWLTTNMMWVLLAFVHASSRITTNYCI